MKDDVLDRNMLKKVNGYLRKKYGKVIIDSSTQSSAKKVAKVRVRGQEIQSVPGKQPRLILYYTISHGGELPQEEQFDGVWRAIKDQVRFLEHQKRLAEESER